MPNTRPRVLHSLSTPWDRTLRVLLPVFVLLIIVLEFPGAHEFLLMPTTGIDYRGLRVQSVRDPAKKAGIRPGDEILAVDGDPIRNRIHYRYLIFHERKQQRRTITVRRGQRVLDIPIQFQPPKSPVSRIDAARTMLAFVFLLIGVWVYGRRPGSIGMLFASVCSLLAFFLTHRPAPPFAVLQLAEEWIDDGLTLLFPAVLLHFFMRFPAAPGRRHQTTATRSHIGRVYAAPLIIAAAGWLLATARFEFLPVPAVIEKAILFVSTAYFVVYVVLALVVFMRRYHRCEPAQKVKLRVVMMGTIIGFVPLIVVVFLRNEVSAHQNPPGLSLDFIAVLCLSFVPISFAYAIVKHNAIELNRVVRRSIVYAFLTGGIVAVYYLVVRVLTGLLVNAFGVNEYVWGTLTLLLLALMFAPARDGLQRVVDRLFYRKDVRYTSALMDFNRGLSGCTRRSEVWAHFCATLEATVSPQYIAIYRRDADAGRFVVERKTADTGDLPDTCSGGCFLARYLERYRRPLMVEYVDPEWAHRHADRATRDILDVEDLGVCLPLPVQDAIIAVALIGKKRSHTAYTTDDSQLLQALAEPTARVLQNCDLLASSLERERLKSEVMLARDIQLSLLPVDAPQHVGLEIVGRMTNSLEVGGDYFDYFSLPDTRPGVCIGDVSGKGVPAAMLMTSLRAVFRNAVLKSGLGPAEVNNELNEFVVHNARDGQFASFFYGVLDCQKWTVTYSSAGQCPALLVRDRFVDRLGEGGMLLGAADGTEYFEGRVHLEPGDHLVLYTDGVTEQSNPAGIQYTEQRFISFLEANRNLPAPALLQCIFDDVAAFAAGPQADDITVVIVCRKVG